MNREQRSQTDVGRHNIRHKASHCYVPISPIHESIHQRWGEKVPSCFNALLCSTKLSNWNSELLSGGLPDTSSDQSTVTTRPQKDASVRWRYQLKHKPFKPHEPSICTNCSASHGLTGTSFWSSPKCCSKFLVFSSNVVELWYICSSFKAEAYLSPLGSAQSPSLVQSSKYTHT